MKNIDKLLSELGVSPQKEKQFLSKGIRNAAELIEYIPVRYSDRRETTGITDVGEATFYAVLRNVGETSTSTGLSLVTAHCIALTGENVYLSWFGQSWLKSQLSGCIGNTYFVAAKLQIDEFRTKRNYGVAVYKASNPSVFEPENLSQKKIYAEYRPIKGMSASYLNEKIDAALLYGDIHDEILPLDILRKAKLPSLNVAYKYLHRPQTPEEIESGKSRLLFNDMLYFALHNELSARSISSTSPYVAWNFSVVKKVSDNLPFKLTTDQSNAINSICKTMSSGSRLNALVQGDVGCGKTAVAILAIAAAVSNGWQAVLMAPTQVLANQHYEEVKKTFEPLGYNIEFLSNARISKKDKTEKLKNIASGASKIIVGTHSVFSSDVEYAKLGLVITDEEHKFGVEQKAAIVRKASEGVHSMTMSATPIPRSMAEVIFSGGIQIFSIRTMPNGRKPIITEAATTLESSFGRIEKELNNGQQIYVVCPMIEDSDSDRMANVHSVEETYELINEYFSKLGYMAAVLTGKTKKEELDVIMSDYCANKINILIATTVIEVGVNNPNATVILVTSAERFGLSQLHQLRGRVGRGNAQSYCILQSDSESEKSSERIRIMCQYSSGFDIAEKDLELRGAGDILGTRQSGENKYISEIYENPRRYEIAKIYAKFIVDNNIECKLYEQVLTEKNSKYND